MTAPRRTGDREFQVRLEEQIRGVEKQITALTLLVTKQLGDLDHASGEAEKRSRLWFDRTWPAHEEAHGNLDTRLAELENIRTRGEGAMSASKLLYGALMILAPVAAWLHGRGYLGIGR